MTEMWTTAGVASFHDIGMECGDCHVSGGVGQPVQGVPQWLRRADLQRVEAAVCRPANKVSIDAVTLTGNVMDVKFSSGKSAIVPELTLSFYGYDAKQMLVSSHTRERRALRERPHGNDGSEGRLPLRALHRRQSGLRAADQPAVCRAGGQQARCLARADGPHEVRADDELRPGRHPDPDHHRQGQEGGNRGDPRALDADGEVVALNAQTKTFDLVGNAFVANYYQGTNAVSSVPSATPATTHSARPSTTRRTAASVTVCRTCHVTTSGGAHLEMQSRGIDSYVHAIHKFQVRCDTTTVTT